jgi:methionyl-tRNA formyltransferase
VIQRAAFLGSKSLGLDILRCLLRCSRETYWHVVHPDDRTDSRSNLAEFEAFARGNNLDFRIAASAVASERIIAEIEPQVAFVSGWYGLFKDQVLESVPHGFYGIHNGLLPRYRGGSPLVWSIINGESEVGATVFRLGSGMDDGDVLHRVRVPLTPEENVADALDKIRTALVKTLPSVWKRLSEGVVQLEQQDHALATYCGQRGPDDGLIDWNQPAKRVHDFVRAQTPPYPGAFTLVESKKVMLLKTEVLPSIYYGIPGQILHRSRDGVSVACGDFTAIVIREASVSNQRIPPLAAFPSISLRLRQ